MANKNAKKIAITFNRDNTRELAMLNYIESKVSMSIYIKQLILDKMVSEGYMISTSNVPDTNMVHTKSTPNTNHIGNRYVSNTPQIPTIDIQDTNQVSAKYVADAHVECIGDVSDTNKRHIEDVSNTDDFDFDNLITEEEVIEKEDKKIDYTQSLMASMNSFMK